MSRTLIVIVNFRTAELVIDCLRTLSRQISEFKDIQTVIVDNNSGDNSNIRLSSAIKNEKWSPWARTLQLDNNGGFAYGNNASIRIELSSTAPPDYILLLNPDTLVQPGAIKALVDFMDTHRNAGIAGSQLENNDGSVDCSAHPFPSPFGELEGAAHIRLFSHLQRKNLTIAPSQTSPYQCDWVSGACMIIRRQVIEDIGLMDEKYFLYFEEVDFCRRAHQANWQCWHVPESRIIHLEGSSTGIRTTAKRRAAYWYDSRRRYFVKNYGVLGLVFADGLWVIGRLIFLLRNCVNPFSIKHVNDPKWFMFDLIWGDVSAILKGQLRSIHHPEEHI